jgi:hypothetical protein
LIAAFLGALFLVGVTAEAPPERTSGEAERLFQEGLKAYDAREFARAIEAFEAAHRLSPLPEILFDIGMAHRALGDCQRAVKSFDAFIRAVPADHLLLPKAHKRRAELAPCSTGLSGPASAGTPGSPLAQSSVLPTTTAPVSPTPSPTPAAVLVAPRVTAGAASSPRHNLWRDACGVSLGSTAVLTAAGLIFGWQARSAQRETETVSVWNDAAGRADERGRAYGDVATSLLLSAGVAALVTATTCLVARARH